MKLLLVDGHAVTRDGLVATFAQLRPEAVVLQARDLTEALRLVAEHDDLAAVVLVDGASESGLEAIGEFRSARADLPVVLLSASETARDAREAFTRGAFGYVPRSASARTLLSAVRLVVDGDRYVPPLILDEPPEPQRPEARGEGRPPALTDRQIEVLRRLSDGYSNKAIARDLGVSEKTIKAHVTAILKALNVLNRIQAATAGREAGLV